MICPDCGASLNEGETCEDNFHLLLGWEWEYRMQSQHHLLVLVYHLQHPRLYSPETLIRGVGMLAAFAEEGVTPALMRQHIGKEVSSTNRTHKITGTPDSYGQYPHPIQWEITCRDITRAGWESYEANIVQWAEVSLRNLRVSGNFAALSEKRD